MAFLYPYFLLLSLAVVVPIAVHLFNFHRFKKVAFTNVAMLKNIALLNKKQNKLYERLLLLFRCLLIIFLSLLFAQPYIKEEEDKLVSEKGNAVVVVLDNSFSMQNISNKGSAFQQAKSKVEEIIREYSDNDVFCLLTMDMQGKYKHFVSKKYFMEFLKEVEISPASEPYSNLINTAHHLLKMRNEKSKRVFFVSDYQTSQLDFNNIKQDSTIKDVFIPILISNINNIYVDSILFDRNIYQKGQKVDLKISVTNASEERAENIPVKLYIDDIQQSMANISIEKHSSAVVNMSFVLKQSGIVKGKIQILDSPIVYDDDFYFALNISDRIKALAINHNKENVYINRLFSNNQEIQLDNMSENAIDFSKFGLYNVIILAEVENISSGLCQELNNFRQNGGSLVIVPPLKMDVSAYNSAMDMM
ncbi:MAG: BatA and WFA domain-containing protein, partial [Bacteroidota bacterium]|nr:BatA and WFA domain-containing protein [Bacteroidota bacterium]